MGCGSCSISGKLPMGCKNNGNCGTGGCHQMNTFDWLSDISYGKPSPYYEITFNQGIRKAICRNDKNIQVDTGDLVVVKSAAGYDIGMVTLSGEIVDLQMRKKKVKQGSKEILPIIRRANDKDLELYQSLPTLEEETLRTARVIIKGLGLDMKLSQVQYQGDGTRATFYYTADDRVDFRELIKQLAKNLNIKVDMKQIGPRQEAAILGGIGDCGRELCCSTWLHDFKSVSTNTARYQNLAINQAKLTGQCGRLKCCLNFELDSYVDALKDIPKKVDTLQTEGGRAQLQKTDIFRKIMWYSYEGSTEMFPISAEEVKKQLNLSKKGKKIKQLELLKINQIEN